MVIALGHSEAMLNMADSAQARLFYRSEGGTNFVVTEPINDEPVIIANGSTVAYSCKSLDQDYQFHEVAIANGGTSIEDLPGPRDPAFGQSNWPMYAILMATCFAASTFRDSWQRRV